MNGYCHHCTEYLFLDFTCTWCGSPMCHHCDGDQIKGDPCPFNDPTDIEEEIQ